MLSYRENNSASYMTKNFNRRRRIVTRRIREVLSKGATALQVGLPDRGTAKKVKKSVLSFSVLYESAPEGGCVVSVPALPGCHTQGDTLEEAEENIKDAIAVYLESVLSRKEKLPVESCG